MHWIKINSKNVKINFHYPPVMYSFIAGEGTVTCLNFTGVECNTFSLCLYLFDTFSYGTRSGFLWILL